jgi:enoyl-CoA hydratase/carnithine racemase
MSDSPVRTEKRNGAWLVTLNRPARGNACSAELVRSLDEALSKSTSDGAEAFVLRGEGRHFCTGFDLAHLDRESDDTLLARFVRIELLLQRLARAPFPTIAVAHGRTMGAGADLFAACRVRLAVADTSFAFPGARGFGVVLGTRRLAVRVGTETALDWVGSGRMIGADEAHRRGLVTALVDDARHVEHHLPSGSGIEPWLDTALRCAAEPASSAHDAADLDVLVRSTARPGLRDRILAYAEGAAARRAASSP